MIRIIRIGNGRVSPLAGFLAIGVGLLLLVFGLALLAGIAIVGGVVGAGILLARMITGRRAPSPHAMPGHATPLDPRMEVRARIVDAPVLPPSRPGE